MDEAIVGAAYTLWRKDNQDAFPWEALDQRTRECMAFVAKWSASPYLRLDGTLLGDGK